MSQAPDIIGTEGQRLDATVTVYSTFSSQETQTVELRVEDGGTTVHTDSQSVTLQDSADSQQITLSWPTTIGDDAGVYDLFIESGQDTIQALVEVTVPESAQLPNGDSVTVRVTEDWAGSEFKLPTFIDTVQVTEDWAGKTIN